MSERDDEATIRDVLNAVHDLAAMLEDWDAVALGQDVRRAHALLDKLGAPTRDHIGTGLGVTGRIVRLLEGLRLYDRHDGFTPLGQWLNDATIPDLQELDRHLNLPKS